MKKLLMTIAPVAAGLIALIGAAQPAAAKGTVILEGSDAIGFHSNINGSAAAYRDQTFIALGGSDPRNIAVVGQGSFGAIVSGTHAITDFADLGALAGSGPFSKYAAIYILGNGGCCNSGTSYIAGQQAALSAYVNAGGTVEIGNYDGNSAWDFLTGGSNNSLNVAGIGGALGGPGCTDGETVSATGLANGFTQPGSLGCWTHQAYSMPYFATLGFTKSFFDSDPAFAATNPGYGPFSSLLSNGNTITGGGNVPEPATWALMVIGFGGLGAAMRSRRKLATAA
jgi:hypothetical protein